MTSTNEKKVAITPAAGVVAGWGAIALGLGSGVIPWVSLNVSRFQVYTKTHRSLSILASGMSASSKPSMIASTSFTLTSSVLSSAVSAQVSSQPQKVVLLSVSPTLVAPLTATADRSGFRLSQPSL